MTFNIASLLSGVTISKRSAVTVDPGTRDGILPEHFHGVRFSTYTKTSLKLNIVKSTKSYAFSVKKFWTDSYLNL